MIDMESCLSLVIPAFLFWSEGDSCGYSRPLFWCHSAQEVSVHGVGLVSWSEILGHGPPVITIAQSG